MPLRTPTGNESSCGPTYLPVSGVVSKDFTSERNFLGPSLPLTHFPQHQGNERTFSVAHFLRVVGALAAPVAGGITSASLFMAPPGHLHTCPSHPHSQTLTLR